jgi:hypothetical protein
MSSAGHIHHSALNRHDNVARSIRSGSVTRRSSWGKCACLSRRSQAPCPGGRTAGRGLTGRLLPVILLGLVGRMWKVWQEWGSWPKIQPRSPGSDPVIPGHHGRRRPPGHPRAPRAPRAPLVPPLVPVLRGGERATDTGGHAPAADVPECVRKHCAARRPWGMLHGQTLQGPKQSPVPALCHSAADAVPWKLWRSHQWKRPH